MFLAMRFAVAGLIQSQTALLELLHPGAVGRPQQLSPPLLPHPHPWLGSAPLRAANAMEREWT